MYQRFQYRLKVSVKLEEGEHGENVRTMLIVICNRRSPETKLKARRCETPEACWEVGGKVHKVMVKANHNQRQTGNERNRTQSIAHCSVLMIAEVAFARLNPSRKLGKH